MAMGGKIDSKEADPRPKRRKAEEGRYLAKAHSQASSVGQRRSDSHRPSGMTQDRAVVMLVLDLSSGHQCVKKSSRQSTQSGRSTRRWSRVETYRE